jgi:hypothetical protein
MNFNFSNRRINQLTAATGLVGTELIPIFQNNTLRSVSVSQISAGTGTIQGGLPSGGVEGSFLKKTGTLNYESTWSLILEDDLPPTVVQGLERLFIVGDLTPASELSVICDYAIVWTPYTIKAIDIICPKTSSTGEIVIDLLYRATPGGELSSLYTSNQKPSLSCNGYASWATFTGNNLPNTIELVQGSIIGFKIISAPIGCEDLYVTVR